MTSDQTLRGLEFRAGPVGGRRVLLADSDPEVQQTVRLVATKHGHEIVLATTGAETLTQAVASSPDLIVLDTVFPDADGRDVLAQLKANAITARIPVVVWTGGREARPSDRQIALELGAEDYVDMVNTELLVRRLERILVRLSAKA